MTQTQSETQQNQFYLLLPDSTRGGKGHGVAFENLKELRGGPRLVLRPKDGGFPALSAKPKLVYEPGRGVTPQDLEGGMSGYWLVSERLKSVMIGTDPDAFEFVECDFYLADGTEGPRYYLCDVVRTVDAVDESASKLNVLVGDEYSAGKHYRLTGGASLVFKNDVVGDALVFRTPFSGDLVFCSRRFRDAVRAAGIGSPKDSRGLWFTAVDDL
ncbi:DUF1629 domain-containing protein [Stenotrophomonas oahuensis]|uniref:DUF1629 domain-containing protein n=1 Tax=Stenotrophomonas oahuensis TaxID=3003271 RepID=A0ABY9YQL0_9GAMM|nr:DUF1629 domain-containing protein [Stenotrophomonas sp. A5586]WNH52745.1 DUF1629 domain-containing protein [Stenotrophomonas sp. A5586]